MAEVGAAVQRPPAVQWDADANGALTAADAWPLLQDLFFLPGDWLIWALAAHLPRVAAWLGGGPGDYGGVWSGFLSAAAWSAAVIAVSIAFLELREADRRLTRAAGCAYAESLRAVRMLSVLWRARGARRRPARPPPALDVVGLTEAERTAFRLFVHVPAGHALTTSEVARPLGMRLEAAGALLERLTERGLLARALGGHDGEESYALSRAGRAALLEKQSPAEAGL